MPPARRLRVWTPSLTCGCCGASKTERPAARRRTSLPMPRRRTGPAPTQSGRRPCARRGWVEPSAWAYLPRAVRFAQSHRSYLRQARSRRAHRQRSHHPCAGADLRDGTPIYDIKPYIPFADCHPDATGGWIEDAPWQELDVDFPQALQEMVPSAKLPAWSRSFAKIRAARVANTSQAAFTIWLRRARHIVYGRWNQVDGSRHQRCAGLTGHSPSPPKSTPNPMPKSPTLVDNNAYQNNHFARELSMKYDFSSLIDRHGMDSIAVDSGARSPAWLRTHPTRASTASHVGGGHELRHGAHGPGVHHSARPAPHVWLFRSARRVLRPHHRMAEPSQWRRGLAPEHIGYENGVLGGVVSTLRAYVQPGDAVLVHSPTYIGFTKSIEAAGYRIVHSPLKLDDQACGVWTLRTWSESSSKTISMPRCSARRTIPAAAYGSAMRSSAPWTSIASTIAW